MNSLIVVVKPAAARPASHERDAKGQTAKEETLVPVSMALEHHDMAMFTCGIFLWLTRPEPSPKGTPGQKATVQKSPVLTLAGRDSGGMAGTVELAGTTTDF